MIEYTVKVYSDGDKSWYLNGKLHREDGPAIEDPYGYKAWYLNGKKLTEQQHKAASKVRSITSKHTCEGKIVEIDGKKYKLMGV